ncbi:translation initiation factor IF-2 [Acidiplasma aeolicum]|jgi:translation initiation factor 5B|uniref:Translation initiation factor IF-2 n=2 Tax=Acidiplasma aeolicum TaxID=507754 RepID=A0A0Q0WGH6_9ARCH|nr:MULTISPECIES: translation initiation factor IF-2 [Acidiplasma]KPV46506.1 translation initiation factor IF-2 [Acidiplasma aeolicum]KQB34553.1 translation initiation factor IF-2 [Acidiplasma aeolicum]
METAKNNLREPIVCVLGHVDHGKTTLLDDIRGTTVAKKESGGITQKIGATDINKNLLEKIVKNTFRNVSIKIPGLLFIDTPGHVAFSNMRARGGALADIAILVIDINEGLMPQTIESIDILKKFKTPFIIAANKIDLIPYFISAKNKSFYEVFKIQRPEYREELDKRIYNIINQLYVHGISSDRYDRISDFTKTFAIVPVSAKLNIGIADILMVLTGLAQKFLENEIKFSDESTRGTVIEVKKEGSLGTTLDTILYQGTLARGDTIALNTANGPQTTKVKAILVNSSNKGIMEKDKVSAAAGIRILITDKLDVTPGTSIIKILDNPEQAFEELTRESKPNINVSENGVTIKAEALGSLEAVAYELDQNNIKIREASIGDITKKDIINVSTLNDPLERIIIGFNVGISPDGREAMESSDIKVITGDVIYSLIEEASKWLSDKKHELEEEKKNARPVPSKFIIMPDYIFRAAKPVIVGIRVLSGRVKVGDKLITENNKYAGTIKSLRDGDVNRQFADAGMEVSCAIDGVILNRHIFPDRPIYVDIPESVAKELKNQELSDDIKETLDEIIKIKRRENQFWGF